MGDRAEDDEADFAAGAVLRDEIHQLGDFTLKAGRCMLGAVASWIRIEGWVVLAIGELFK